MRKSAMPKLVNGADWTFETGLRERFARYQEPATDGKPAIEVEPKWDRDLNGSMTPDGGCAWCDHDDDRSPQS